MDRERRGPDFYEALGRTIQVLRTDQGLDRKDLAERAEISYSYLAAIENGKKPPSSRVLFRIADALSLRSHELLASVESRWEMQAGSPHLERPSQRSPWFHGSPDATAFSMEAPAAAPAPAAVSERPTTPMQRSVPRSPTGFLMELQRLSDGLDDDDRELVIDLARRLAEND